MKIVTPRLPAKREKSLEEQLEEDLTGALYAASHGYGIDAVRIFINCARYHLELIELRDVREQNKK